MSSPSDVQDLIDYMRGTAASINAQAEERGIDMLDDAVTSAVDEAIFECTDCGWWCDISEEVSEFVEDASDLLCDQCARDNHGYNGDD